MPKYNIEKAREIFGINGHILLEITYVNTVTPMKYKCSCGNISQKCLSDMRRKGGGCPECSSKRIIEKKRNKKVEIEKITEYFLSQGCQLLNDYISYFSPLKFICKCGRIGETAWYSFKKGRRCGCCQYSKTGRRTKKYNLEEVKEIFKNEGCEFIDNEYKGYDIKLKYKCSCGKIDSITLHNFKNGHRCYNCGIKKNLGSGNHKWIEDRELKKSIDSFRKRYGGMLLNCLKQSNQPKINKSQEILGYSYKELIKHITSHSNWNLVKNIEWHIDHIFPIKAFFENNIQDPKIINCLKNLQPLSAKDNLSKSDKYDKKEFIEWLKENFNPL